MELYFLKERSMSDKGFKKILIIDDDDTILSLCEEVLHVAGYQVMTASSGFQALDELKKSRFDLIITDINMPELGGLDLYSRAVMEFPQLRGRFLFMTGDVTPEAQAVIKSQNIEFILKPFRISELLLSVESAIISSLQNVYRKNEIGKRQEGRFDLSAECDIFEEGLYKQRYLIAETVNVSCNGIKIVYEGAPMAAESVVSVFININGLSVHRYARIIWSKPVDARKSSAGIRFDEPMPVYSIINVIPAKAV